MCENYAYLCKYVCTYLCKYLSYYLFIYLRKYLCIYLWKYLCVSNILCKYFCQYLWSQIFAQIFAQISQLILYVHFFGIVLFLHCHCSEMTLQNSSHVFRNLFCVHIRLYSFLMADDTLNLPCYCYTTPKVCSPKMHIFGAPVYSVGLVTVSLWFLKSQRSPRAWLYCLLLYGSKLSGWEIFTFRVTFCQFSWWPGVQISPKKKYSVDKYTKDSNGMALFLLKVCSIYHN